VTLTRVIPALAASALFLTACGGAGDDVGDAATSSSAASSTESAPESAGEEPTTEEPEAAETTSSSEEPSEAATETADAGPEARTYTEFGDRCRWFEESQEDVAALVADFMPEPGPVSLQEFDLVNNPADYEQGIGCRMPDADSPGGTTVIVSEYGYKDAESATMIDDEFRSIANTPQVYDTEDVDLGDDAITQTVMVVHQNDNAVHYHLVVREGERVTRMTIRQRPEVPYDSDAPPPPEAPERRAQLLELAELLGPWS